jgi:hypothetical protein
MGKCAEGAILRKVSVASETFRRAVIAKAVSRPGEKLKGDLADVLCLTARCALTRRMRRSPGVDGPILGPIRAEFVGMSNHVPATS